MTFYSYPVISSQNMQLIEKAAIDRGSSAENFMKKAAIEIAAKIEKEVSFRKIKNKKVLLLAGFGNNAGDGYLALSHLLKKGFSCRAYELFLKKNVSSLCQKAKDLFLQAGGEIIEDKSFDNLKILEDEIILDGIFGIGLKDQMDSFVASLIEKINLKKNLKIAIDIPSGLNGTTGFLQPIAFKADKTFYLGCAKSGFFKEEGFKYVGKIERIDFGLDEQFIKEEMVDFLIPKEEDLLAKLPEISRVQHKYERGEVLGIAGSKEMEGAANLAGKAALRSGAGIVKLFINSSSFTSQEFIDEIIKKSLKEKNFDELFSFLKKAKAIFVGPGFGRDEKSFLLLEKVIKKIEKPFVLDADGLYFYSKNLTLRLPKKCILTPHRGEMLRLLSIDKGELMEAEFLAKCQTFAQEKEVILVLKGAPTFIFAKDKKPLILSRGDPGMATAGSGDVLTGMIAAFLAKDLDPYVAAALGVLVHEIAGELAAVEKGSYSLLASDIIEKIPQVLKKSL